VVVLLAGTIGEYLFQVNRQSLFTVIRTRPNAVGKMGLFSRKQGHTENRWTDRMGHLVKAIERSAPRNYREDRESFYYNYHMMGLYRKPLEGLLETIGQSIRMEEIGEDVVCSLFLKLKDFYDPRGKMALSEAMEDPQLRRRLQQVLLVFYNRKDVDMARIWDYLQRLNG